MNKKVVLLIVFAVMIAIFVTTVSVNSGVLPSPYRSQTLVLEGIVYVLDARTAQFYRILQDQSKLPNPNGLIGMFNAMNTDIMVLGGLAKEVIYQLPDDPTTLNGETTVALNAFFTRTIEFRNLVGYGREVLPYHDGVDESLDILWTSTQNLFDDTHIFGVCERCHVLP